MPASAGYGGSTHGEPQSGDLPKAITISGAGTEDANGLYKATTKEYCDAPVYEHAEKGQDLKITREPHKNPKTGAIKHGWLLGQSSKPLYGAPTESLTVPSTGWKKFGGEAPLPAVKVHWHVEDMFFASADDSKSAGDAAMEREDWKEALRHFTAGIDALKRTSDRFSDAFNSRAPLLLCRRGSVNLRLKEPKAALSNAVAALELDRGLTPAEEVAKEALGELGFKEEVVVQKILEPVGSSRILDPAAPLVLRCVDRWIADIISSFAGADTRDVELPAPIHMPADRYLDGLDEETRAAVIKRYVPETPFGGTATVSSAAECLELMRQWEEVFSGPEFQLLPVTDSWIFWPRTMVAESLSRILEPKGFAPGRPGLARCVKQMQIHWSTDRACANKALDLEELADVSLADLE
eukprot:TRINITY_DN23664_c0_g2_i1.p1 TRINITY_DN23664_c0_g2~~TRINITY_DN23664_c0_g2_i1.p1  ORF type:complete len:410 (+),score=95.13 TRINITY_DN23664_c0_g2_i1:71-1300(+)